MGQARLEEAAPLDETSRPFCVTESSSLNDLALEAYLTAKEHGWWDGADPNVGEKFMLMVSELSEAFEHYRDGVHFDEIFYVDGKPDGIAVELADLFIRLCDFIVYFNVPIEQAIIAKMQYNRTRPYRHGGKKC